MIPDIRPIKGYEGRYSVDNFGIVYTTRRRGSTGGVLPQRLNSTGYYRVDLQDKNKRRSVFVHRLVAEAFIEKEPSRDFVNHKDGNKLNNRVDNLEWCTRSENIVHAYKTGLMHEVHVSGDDHPNSKISDNKAIEMALLRMFGINGIEIGKRFNVTKHVVYRIMNGKRKLRNGMTAKEYIEKRGIDHAEDRQPDHGREV